MCNDRVSQGDVTSTAVHVLLVAQYQEELMKSVVMMCFWSMRTLL